MLILYLEKGGIDIKTIVCKWKDDKIAAYSICGDDSLHSQLDFMIPEMLKRGFKGTLWVNPGRGTTGEKGFCWNSRKSEWLAAARNGFDFANHTIYHVGARFYDEAEYEIGESARIIREANPSQYLTLFLRGGGTTWNISVEEIDEIVKRNDCVRGRGGGITDDAWHEETNTSATAVELIGYVNSAIEEGSWHIVACHGVGLNAEWLPTDEEPFIALLDYLEEKRDIVWVETNTKIHKYMKERELAKVNVIESSDKCILLELTAGLNTVMYDYPLTLKTEVPSSWTKCTVSQGRNKKIYDVMDGVIQYEALPDRGIIVIEVI